ncbi:hypothetical protein N402_05240 [Helicobacter pylori FD423]|nr:hypothetical protein N402_05240 [Helicobacter pylori FD423]
MSFNTQSPFSFIAITRKILNNQICIFVDNISHGLLRFKVWCLMPKTAIISPLLIKNKVKLLQDFIQFF